MPTRRPLSRLLIATVTGVTLALGGIVPAANAAPIPGLDGDGTSSSPYQIASSDDLLAVAEAINGNPGTYADGTYRLTADIDFAGAEFPGIDTFTGVFEGAGHRIKNVVYGHSTFGSGDAGGLAFFRRITDATVRNIVLDGVTAENGTRTQYVAGIAMYALRSTVSGNSVIDATLSAPSAEKTGGLIAEMDGGLTTNNWVDATITANKMAGGIASYSKNGVTISNNLVSADMTVVVGGGPNGTRGVDAGLIINYPGNPSSNSVFSGNVAYDGSVDYSGKIDGFVGRIAGYTGYDGWTATNNLANSAITLGGQTVTGPGTKNQHGTDTSAEALAQRDTYAGLGWDFENAWRFDEVLGHPVPTYVHSLFGDGTEQAPFEIGSEEDLEFLATQLNEGNSRYTGDKSFIVTADLDFTSREPWPGIDSFTGVFDGAGHRVSGLVYTSDGGSKAAGFFDQLTDATVRNLVLDGITADFGTSTQFVAGLAGLSTRSTLTGNTVINASLSAPSAEKAAGITTEMDGGAISGNWVQATVTANKMAGGIAAYSKNGVTISDNLVDADLTVVVDGGAQGTRGVDAGLVINYPGNPNGASSYTGNVVFDGTIDYSGKVDGFAGRIVGYTGYEGWTATDNLANDAITIGGQPVTGPGTKNQHGIDTTAEALGQKDTYTGIGWDFDTMWRWDDELGHPIPKYILPAEVPNRVSVTFYGDSSTQRAFTWYSEIEDGAGAVVLSTDREFPAGSSTVQVDAIQETSEHGEVFYRAVATGLTPGTRYYYRLGDAVQQVWSTVGTFTTSPGDGDFTFIDLTDSQSQNLGEAQLSASTMSKSLTYVPEAEFVVHNGDIVEHGDKEQDWIDLLGSAQSSLMSTTLAPAAGNHDQADNAFIDHFTLQTPNGQDARRGAYYSFDYNDAHFMVLNTNEDSAQSVSNAQVEWLRQDASAARAAGAKWLILTMHKGLYTTATHLDDADVIAMRKVLMPVIDELDIDLVLQGHDHVISRSKVLVSDPDGVEGASPVESTRYTEIVNGKRADYTVDPQGTIFFLPNTSGAKHYTQATSVGGGIDLEAFLQLFDRTGEQGTENFSAISVTDDKLTVDLYDIRDKGIPRLFESFGIDREVSGVDAQLAALPAVGDLTVEDAPEVSAARDAVDALTAGQRSALVSLSVLEAAESRLRELTGLVSTDGSVVAWAKPDAESRQTITVRNGTRSDFAGAPVQVRIENTPAVERDELAFFSTDGAPLPYEVETWEPGAVSTVWVKVPLLAAESATTIWGYFGGDAVDNDPAAVWEGHYSLVEHFAGQTDGDQQRVDSTGTATGTVVGAGIESEVSDRGTARATFGDARLQYPGDIGGDYDRISISGVYSLTAADLAALSGKAPVIAKESATADGQATFWQGVLKNDSKLGTRFAGNSFEFGDVDINSRFDLLADGEDHLVTQVYDGMTYSVFVDGHEVSSQMVEYRTSFSNPAVYTTIGDYYTNTGELSSPFHGTIDEVQIAGVAFTPDFEAFRYANYLGDAVSSGVRVDRASEPVTLIVGTPASGTAIEAGLTDVTGTVSERAILTARVAGEEVFSEKVDAGTFSVQVPVNAIGEQQLEFRATSEEDGERTSDAVEIALTVTDTVAPAQPEVSDTSDEASPGSTEIRLTATPRTDDREKVEATFYADDQIALDGSNVVVRSGSTTDRLPDAISPTSGAVSADLLPTTVGDNANPYQIYEISLTPEQAAQDQFHLTWSGTADERRVSAYVYDNGARTWLLKDSGSNADGGSVTLDVTAKADENAVVDGTLRLLLWRGLTELPFGEDHDYESMPDAPDFDWGFDHVPDSQLYTQATPEMFVDQMQYVVDMAEERKTSLVLQAGDLVNREYLSQEYQWINAEGGMSLLDEAGLPYMVSWGNHDYSDARNGRVMLPKWYPMSRFAESLAGSPWTFGESQSIDNYYYTAEIAGAKLLLLTVGYFSADNANDAGLAWARSVIESHQDYSVILAIHNSVNGGENNWSNGNVTSQLVDPFSNVKLVLGGHISATGVATRTAANGARVYGVLTDYQGRVYGGQEYLKFISIDAENDLMYFNTYSPYLDKSTSDGPYRQSISESAIPGFHGSDSENYVLEVDLGGSTSRTLTTESLTLAAGEPAQIGPVQTLVGDEEASIDLQGLRAGVAYEWYVDLKDAAGHVTRSALSTFTLAAAEQSAPGAPWNVAATSNGTTVQVTWSAPASDGGAPVTRYEVTLSDGTVKTVDGGVLSADFSGLQPGDYSATVRAENAVGWSEASEASNTVQVVEPTDPGAHDGRITVTGDLAVGGEIMVHGTGFGPGVEYTIELHSSPVGLGTVTADAQGAFELTATIPDTVDPGEHDIVVLLDGTQMASVRVDIAAADQNDNGPGNGGPSAGGDNGLHGSMPETGADQAGLIGWGSVAMVLLIAGLALLLARAHRRRSGRITT